MTSAHPRACVFLDRDGTLNREVDFLRHPSEVELYCDVPSALGRLLDANFTLVVITNQSGIARGYLDEERLTQIHARLDQLLSDTGLATADGGPAIEAYYYCPHHPTEGEPPYRRRCACRKPEPELLARAASELNLDLSSSYMIGDSLRDIDAAAALGVPGILVRTGKGRDQEQQAQRREDPVAVADDLSSAVDRILAS